MHAPQAWGQASVTMASWQRDLSNPSQVGWSTQRIEGGIVGIVEGETVGASTEKQHKKKGSFS